MATAATDLIVLDLELDDSRPEDFSAPLGGQCGGDRPPMVLLGCVRRDGTALAGEEFVAKPYHYGPLVRKIEELLDHRRPPTAGTA